VLVLSNNKVLAQDWMKIIPAVSTCKDVKKLLKVNDCKFPMSKYDYPKYTIYITFSNGKSLSKVLKGRVYQVVILFRELLPLEDYKDNLQNYKIRTEEDLSDNNLIYENKKKGISLAVISFDSGKFIKNISLEPPKKK
jgi:hypothetical protein